MSLKYLSFKKARDLAEQYGTPLLVLSKNQLIENYVALSGSLPRVRLHYAVKSNGYSDILKLLYEAGSCFDICTNGEIDQVINVGVPSNRLLHTHPIKKQHEIEYAIDKGVEWFVFDNQYEIPKLIPYKDKINTLARISIVNPNATVNLAYKFGASPEEAQSLIIKAKKMGIKVRGISFHVGSQNANPYKYVEAIIACRELFNKMALEGIEMDTLNIGGGFPISYVSTAMPIYKFCEPINEALDKYFPSADIISEPGRFICGDAITLITRVIGKSRRNNIRWYYIDDGLYGSFSGKLYDQCDYHIISERKKNPEQCIVGGPTCDSYDVLYTNRALPDLDIDDILLVPSMGAYTSSSATEFNGYPKTPIITID